MNRPVAASKLNHDFSRHGRDFGMSGPWDAATAALFEQTLDDHVNSPGVVHVPGKYRGVQDVVHHFDAATGLNVMTDLAGDLVSGWRLDPRQIRWLFTPPDHNIQ